MTSSFASPIFTFTVANPQDILVLTIFLITVVRR